MVIVIVTPGGDQLPSVAQAAIEALDEAILHWLSRRDGVPLDLSIFLPAQDGMRCQLRSVIADYHAGIATYPVDIVELTDNPLT